ncbi:sensor histidine kinase [Pelagibacterium mangrovi]|uniref:sensor histidine kinase n=1 Tax=Pelagibacterium mangrovi TaxID=3119828 RepID=UPI002FC8B41A
MSRVWRFRSIPVSYRVPLIVALLVLVISVVISERVLDRLSDSQHAHLEGIASTYLDGLASGIMPAVLREDVWEVFDALDRSALSYRALAPVETVVTDAEGMVLASIDPMAVPAFSSLTADYRARFPGQGVAIEDATMTGYSLRRLIHQGQEIGSIYAVFDVSHLFAERKEVLLTLLLTNGALAGLFALGGFFLVRRMVNPMLVLERHMLMASQGAAEPIPTADIPSHDREVANLFHGYNNLVRAERERANFALRLAEEERIASLGRLASGMAHEINNPLGGLLNALDTLRTHGATPSVRETAISLIERGLQGIGDVVRAALAIYRPDRTSRPLRTADIDDVRLLIRPEINRKHQRLEWTVRWDDEKGSCPGAVRQAVLNLLLNASAVTPEYGRIGMDVASDGHHLRIGVRDEGPGMPREIAAILTEDDPGSAVHPGHGLGLWMVRRVVDEAGGRIGVETGAMGGTSVTLELPLKLRERVSNAA